MLQQVTPGALVSGRITTDAMDEQQMRCLLDPNGGVSIFEGSEPDAFRPLQCCTEVYRVSPSAWPGDRHPGWCLISYN